MLTFACPSCRQSADWPDDWRGETVDCPFCGKCLELTNPEPPRREYGDDRDHDRRGRRGRDGRDRDDRGRPDRLEVVSRRDRDDEGYDRDDRDRSVRRREVRCPSCGCRDVPILSKEMAENAWLFIVLGILFWPLIIVGVLMKETWEVCPECRRKIKKVGSPTFG